jgi:hypothetical protein
MKGVPYTSSHGKDRQRWSINGSTGGRELRAPVLALLLKKLKNFFKKLYVPLVSITTKWGQKGDVSWFFLIWVFIMPQRLSLNNIRSSSGERIIPYAV